MIALWVMAGLLSVLAAGLVLFFSARAGRTSAAADPTLSVYQRQLGELDDLAARGLMNGEEQKAAYAEAARRLLKASENVAEPWSASSNHRQIVLVIAGLAALLALVVYQVTGRPGYSDQPMATRIQTWRGSDLSQLTAPQLAAVLQRETRLRPDPEGYRFLALAESQSNNPSAAIRATRKALALAPQRADLWELLGTNLVEQANGEVQADAVAAFQRTLELDPGAVVPRFHLARALAQSGDQAGAVRGLEALQASLSPNDPRRSALDRALSEARAKPGQQGESPLGPQAGMVRGMVQGLAARLKTNPDDPQGWVRLVRSYAVLGDTKARDAALADAKLRYRAQPDVLNQLDEASRTEPMQ